MCLTHGKPAGKRSYSYTHTYMKESYLSALCRFTNLQQLGYMADCQSTGRESNR